MKGNKQLARRKKIVGEYRRRGGGWREGDCELDVLPIGGVAGQDVGKLIICQTRTVVDWHSWPSFLLPLF